ncbi:MAG: DUF1194 domain-containing protein [Rhodobacteraceae bacterium]|nr:DUF1194 domain-containing protein [Paracoccaceae bacterium]
MGGRKPSAGGTLAVDAEYRALVGAALAALVAGPAAAAECRLALALGMDVSRSVSRQDYAIQTGGLIDALTDREIRDAFLGPADFVALAVYEWSGEGYQVVTLPWAEIRSAADLEAALATLRANLRLSDAYPTALGAGLAFGRQMLEARTDCAFRTLDISGDGRSNSGPPPGAVYERGGWGDITVNGLAIEQHEEGLTAYYRREVLRGPGAFVETARRHEDFPAAFRRKLLRELTQAVVGRADQAGPPARPG